MKLATPLFMAFIGLFFASAFGFAISNVPDRDGASLILGLAAGCAYVAVKTAYDIGRRD